jgi:hypothetical protein
LPGVKPSDLKCCSIYFAAFSSPGEGVSRPSYRCFFISSAVIVAAAVVALLSFFWADTRKGIISSNEMKILFNMW